MISSVQAILYLTNDDINCSNISKKYVSWLENKVQLLVSMLSKVQINSINQIFQYSFGDKYLPFLCFY